MELFSSLGICVALVVIFIAFYSWKFSFWKIRNVPTLNPEIPFGTLGNILKRTQCPGEMYKNLYLKMRAKGYKHAGNYLLFVPEYMVLEPELVKCVLQKDFQYFTERGFYYNEKDDPLSANLFTMGGQRWKALREKLTSTFTSGKMKMMFDILLRCSEQLVEAVDQLCAQKKPLNIKDLLARYTTDVIGSCAFGLECNSFKSPDAEFRKNGKKLFEPIRGWRNVQLAFALFQPELARKLGIRLFQKEVTDFFMQVIKDTVEYREKNNVRRNDMLQILIDIKNEGDGITLKEVAGQCILFFNAGFETSSTAMSFCLYELAKNPIIQDQVRNDILSTLKIHQGKITYDSIKEMKYLDKVVNETLRKYPPLAFITRMCVEDYNVPNMNAVVPKNTLVVVPIMGLHYDPEYFPEPDLFDPERFSPEAVHDRRHFTYMPFGEGPRVCIAMRFGRVQTKLGLIQMLKNYKFSLNENTSDELKFESFSLILSSEKDIYLNAEKV